MKTFKDVSIFQGVVQFFTGSKMIRAMYQGYGIYHIYVQRENDYFFDAAISTKAKSPRGIYNAYLTQGI